MQKGVVRKRRPRPLSEYGRQLREKQDLKEQYNLREKQFSNYVKEVLGKTDSPQNLMQRLERRLDNVVFRMGLATNRKQSRQIVSHAHVQVNGRKVDIPSYKVRQGDTITVSPRAKKTAMMQTAILSIKNHDAPSWMKYDKENLEVEIVGEPTLEEIAPNVDIALIFEFYSR